jgi:hypothetical protein
LFPIPSFKDILLINCYPWKITPLLAKLISQSSELLFLLEKYFAIPDPFFFGNNLIHNSCIQEIIKSVPPQGEVYLKDIK